jgi:hypothetical protein
LFVARGEFQRLYTRGRGLSRIYPVMVVEVVDGRVAAGASLTDDSYDLTKLGTPVEIPPGEVPEIDAVRAGGPAATPVPAADRLALDGDPSTAASIEVERTVEDSGPFSISINVLESAAPYSGYQWEVEYPAGLTIDENVEQSEETGMTLCAPASTNTAVPPFEPGNTVYGNGAGCLDANGAASSFVGQLTVLTMRCVARGTHNVHLVDMGRDSEFGSALIAPGGGVRSVDAVSVAIDCR